MPFIENSRLLSIQTWHALSTSRCQTNKRRLKSNLLLGHSRSKIRIKHNILRQITKTRLKIIHSPCPRWDALEYIKIEIFIDFMNCSRRSRYLKKTIVLPVVSTRYKCYIKLPLVTKSYHTGVHWLSEFTKSYLKLRKT